MRTHLASDFFVDPDWRSPVQRPNRAEMSPTAFLGLVAGWSAGLSAVLLLALLVRLAG